MLVETYAQRQQRTLELLPSEHGLHSSCAEPKCLGTRSIARKRIVRCSVSDASLLLDLGLIEVEAQSRPPIVHLYVSAAEGARENDGGAHLHL